MSAQPLEPHADQPSYLALFQLTPLDRVKLVKGGVPARYTKQVLSALWATREAGYEALNLAPATVNRKAIRGQALSTEEGERVVGVAKLIGQVEAMAAEAGEPQFDAAAWLGRWINEPVPALGGERPSDLLDTMEGQALVSETLARMQSGAYA